MSLHPFHVFQASILELASQQPQGPQLLLPEPSGHWDSPMFPVGRSGVPPKSWWVECKHQFLLFLFCSLCLHLLFLNATLRQLKVATFIDNMVCSTYMSFFCLSMVCLTLRLSAPHQLYQTELVFVQSLQRRFFFCKATCSVADLSPYPI